MPSISDMPPEIIIKISRDLTTRELGSLRLASKRTEAATFKPFAREFFRKKQFMFTEFSLQALVDISEHPQLGPELEHLVLGLDGYVGASAHGLTRGQLLELEARASAQECLVVSGVARDMLADALRRLPGLRTVDIRNFRSHTRDRDRGVWNSYGAVEAREAIGTRMGMDFPLPHAAFAMVIQALAIAGRTGIDVEVILRSSHGGLTDVAFALPAFGRDRTLAVVSSMRKLHLDLAPTSWHTPGDDLIRTSHIQTFLSHASGLEWLRLNFRDDSGSGAELVLNWVALPTSVPAPLTGHFTAPIKKLDLGFVRLERATYWNAISRFEDTLEALSLWTATVRITEAHYEDRIDEWTQLFKQLAGLPRLREVTLGRLDVYAHYLVRYVPLYLGPAGDQRQAHHRGGGAADFLRQQAAHARIDWDRLKPAPRHQGGNDDDDDDDSDSDAMHDDEEEEEEVDSDAMHDAMDEDG